MDTNAYYNKEKNLLVLTDENYKPIGAFSGKIAKKKHQEFKDKWVKKPLTCKDLSDEIELCKSVLLNQTDMPAEIRADYQKRYRQAQAQLKILTNKLLQK